MNVFLVIKNALAIIGIITTFTAIYELYKKFLGWRAIKKELQSKIALLESADYFIAHIIHLGGEFSTTYSLQVFSNEWGGYYFNPSKDFVSVSFNRGGDLIVIMPTELSKKLNFIIDFVAGSDQKFEKSPCADICHLPQFSIKNEHFVKFIKASEIEKTDRKIDEEVYKLYGLTSEEIEIVENSNKK